MKFAYRILITLVFCGIHSMHSQHSTTRKTGKPNIIVIYTDDMGIGDLSCYNSGWVQTPKMGSMSTFPLMKVQPTP